MTGKSYHAADSPSPCQDAAPTSRERLVTACDVAARGGFAPPSARGTSPVKTAAAGADSASLGCGADRYRQRGSRSAAGGNRTHTISRTREEGGAVGVLQRFERRLGGLVEGAFAK